MPRVRVGNRPPRKPGRRHRVAQVAAFVAAESRPTAEDPEFGWTPPATGADRDPPPVEIATVVGDAPSEPAPELVALGLPPEDAAGIQKWNYRVLSTMAALTLRATNISEDTRMKRVAALTLAAARHYPESAKYDLAQQIARDAEAVAGKRRAKAAAKLEKAPAAGGAKVIPIRRDG